MEETFTYDNQNRLTEVWLGTTQTGVSAYDSYGRMTAKTANGQVVFYDAEFSTTAKPHAMDAATSFSGVFPVDPQTITYTGFDKVKKIKQGNDSLCYSYGYDHQRIYMDEMVGNKHRTKRYVGNCEYITKTNGNVTDTQWQTYLTGPTGVFAVVMTENGRDKIHYILKDNLGSWTTVADEEGSVEQQLSYDAWGNLRNPNSWSGSFNGTPMFDRGFTGHEHLTAFGLINMNGRVYDPTVSSFLSADRYVSNPLTAQGFNRYAYCMYNPLRFVDPTGWAPRPGGGGNGPDIPPPYVVIDGWASGYKLDEVTITAAPLFNYEFVYTPYYNSGGGGDLQLGLGDNSQPKGHISGGGGGNHGGTIQNQNDNLEIASKVLISANVYTSIISKKYYNPYSKTWMDKNGNIRSFDFNGNGSTGGKNSFGKMMSTKYNNAGRILGSLGVIMSIDQCINASSIDGQIEYGLDAVIGLAGVVAPEFFGAISTVWFLGGKQVVYWYGRSTISPMIEQGINPGIMEYQPFK